MHGHRSYAQASFVSSRNVLICSDLQAGALPGWPAPARTNTVRGLHSLESATVRLDRDELEQALRESGAASGRGALAGVDARPIGIGAMADTFLVRLRWDGAVEGPESLVAKLPSIDPAAARTAASLGAYEREARFYAELAPRTRAEPARVLRDARRHRAAARGPLGAGTG